MLIPSTRNRFTPLLQVSNMSATSVLEDLDGDSSNLYGVVGGTNKSVGPSGSEGPTNRIITSSVSEKTDNRGGKKCGLSMETYSKKTRNQNPTGDIWDQTSV